MSEAEPQNPLALEKAHADFSPLDRMVLDSAEGQFPEISRGCPERNGEMCTITGDACELYSCPKLSSGPKKVPGRSRADK